MSSEYDAGFESLWETYLSTSIRMKLLVKNPEWNLKNIKEYVRKELLDITNNETIVNAFHDCFMLNKEKTMSEMKELTRYYFNYSHNPELPNLESHYKLILNELIEEPYYYNMDNCKCDYSIMDDAIAVYLISVLCSQTSYRYNRKYVTQLW